MATRAFVGVGALDDFQATYQHWGGGPAQLGKDVWHAMRDYGMSWLSNVLAHDWSYAPNRDGLPDSGDCYCCTWTKHTPNCRLRNGLAEKRSGDNCDAECELQTDTTKKPITEQHQAARQWCEYGYLVHERTLTIARRNGDGYDVIAQVQLDEDEPMWNSIAP